MYGIYDTVDSCWIGNSAGPLLYEDLALAKVAARITDVRLGQVPGRTRASFYGEQSVVHKDSVDAEMSAEEALGKLEDGEVI